MHMHLLSRCSALGPGPGSWPLPAFLKSKLLANVDVCPVRCSHRIWSLAVLQGITGRWGYSGGEWVHLWGGERRRDKKDKEKEGNAITFLISRTALRDFFGILTTPWRKKSVP